MDTHNCAHCGKSEDEITLFKCPMCHMRACDDCGYRRGGKFFCRVGCADAFFFGDIDEEDRDEA